MVAIHIINVMQNQFILAIIIKITNKLTGKVHISVCVW